eukprot:1748166-Rhodomonas_salina.3
MTEGFRVSGLLADYHGGVLAVQHGGGAGRGGVRAHDAIPAPPACPDPSASRGLLRPAYRTLPPLLAQTGRAPALSLPLAADRVLACGLCLGLRDPTREGSQQQCTPALSVEEIGFPWPLTLRSHCLSLPTTCRTGLACHGSAARGRERSEGGCLRQVWHVRARAPHAP